MESSALIQVVLVCSPGARDVRELALSLPATATVADSLRASGWRSELPELMAASSDVGIWGRKVCLTQQLRDGDRVEVYRPLTVDPKVARRERFARQGAKTAGLFTQTRAGAKAGY